MWFTRITAPDLKQELLQKFGVRESKSELIQIEVVERGQSLLSKFMYALASATRAHWTKLQNEDEVTENDLSIVNFWSAVMGESDTIGEAALNRIKHVYMFEHEIENAHNPEPVTLLVQCLDSQRNIDCPDCEFVIRMRGSIRSFGIIAAQFRQAKLRISY